MVTEQLTDYVKNQRDLGKTDSLIRTELLNIGWKNDDVAQVIQILDVNSQDNSSIQKSKSINTLSTLLFILAIISIPSAFAGSFILLIMNRSMASFPGGLDYSFLKAFPFVGPISVPGMFAVPLILMAAFRVRSGSYSSWKLAIIVVTTVFLVNIIVGVLTIAFINPIYSATKL